MQKYLIFGILVICLIAGCVKQIEKKSGRIDADRLSAASELIINDFSSSLKKELLAAMAQGGPVNAIHVCSEKAPAIAAHYSQLPGVTISRVSLKQRNATFAPDQFEIDALTAFAADSATMPQVKTEFIEGKDKKISYRYIKEIKTGNLCLNCHGDPATFSPELKAALAETYPDDQATGYHDGESRGAFSITMKIPECETAVDSILGDAGH